MFNAAVLISERSSKLNATEEKHALYESISLLYEDQHFIAISKPSGLPSESQNSEDLSCARWFRTHYTHLSPGAHPAEPRATLNPGLIHRLDVETSGVLLFAKTALTLEKTVQHWKSNSIRKIYHALTTSEEVLSAPQEIRLPLGHSSKSSKRMLPYHPERCRGKPLQTFTRILSVEKHSDLNLVQVEILTGVRHQIRATLAHLKHPILGDPIYHGEPYSRLMLHHSEVQIDLSTFLDQTLKPITVKSPLPSLFQSRLA